MDQQAVVERLRAAIGQASQAAWAKAHGMTQQYVNATLKGERTPGPQILEALGLERVISYQVKETRDGSQASGHGAEGDEGQDAQGQGGEVDRGP